MHHSRPGHLITRLSSPARPTLDLFIPSWWGKRPARIAATVASRRCRTLSSLGFLLLPLAVILISPEMYLAPPRRLSTGFLWGSLALATAACAFIASGLIIWMTAALRTSKSASR